jgi:predicted dehydrogenase
MIRVAVVGLGKMGLSHYAIARAHPHANVTAICDSSRYVLDVLHKYTGIATYTDYRKMLDSAPLDAAIIATPTRLHTIMVRQALERNLHTFCEKPFCLLPSDAEHLAMIAEQKGVVNQVGYHNRFLATFQEVKRLLANQAIGKLTHVLAEAYGPVVLRSKGSTWRTSTAEGGGCLYDYAAHPLNLLNWYFGSPLSVAGSVLKSIFSRDTDDEVYTTLQFDGGLSAHLSVNWSDESYRKMSTKISVWGTNGRIVADRQECAVYLRNEEFAGPPYIKGWNLRYATELSKQVWFYLRGEEYSSQLEYFFDAVQRPSSSNINSFAESAKTDALIAAVKEDARSALPNTGRVAAR